MATVTTVTGIGFPASPMTRWEPLRGATPRSHRTASPTTYRRRRIAAAVLALGVVVVAGQAGVALGGSPPLAAPERTPTSADVPFSESGTVVVREGDTLWSIATRLAPGEDPRPLVDAMSAERDGAPLEPGERVSVPG